MILSSKMHNQPKPAFARFRVEYRTGSGYDIIDPRGKVVGHHSNRDAALTRAEALQLDADRAAKRGSRACLCCGREFQSEGIHNRMCGPCRARDDPLGIYGYAGSGDGRRPRRSSGM